MTRSTIAKLCAIGALVAGGTLAACSSEPEVTSTQSEDATATDASETVDTDVATTVVVTTSEAPETTVPATTIPETTEPTTTVPETTTIPPTTAPIVPAGWSSAEFPDTVFPPCCASNWYGVPSPAAPADPAAPLADGLYRLNVSPWSADLPDQLDIEVRRFEQCSNLPEGSCEFYESYAPDELGVEDTVIREETVRLDDTIRAGVVGWANCTGDPQYGNGANLQGLITSFDAANQAIIAPRLAAGEDPFDVITDLAANPNGGFGPVTGECANEFTIVFEPGEGPALLMQAVYSFSAFAETGAYEPIPPMELLNATVLGVEDGVYTLYFYAGFYS